jgi:prepilin-type N-terminal cleavage/methylation domain-containing protein
MIIKRGYTLVEMMVVLLIFVFIFGAVITIMLASDRNWRTGRDIIIEQQEARKAIGSVVRLLRQSNPQWGITIENDKILFYRPVFDANGQIIDTRWVIYKLNPLDPHQLIKSEQGLPTAVITQDVEELKFSGGCAGCAAFNCAALAADCPVVAIEIKTRRHTLFTLNTKVLLRNTNAALPEDVQVAEPPEGEF